MSTLEKTEKLLDSTVPRAPGSPGALIQMQIKRSIFKIYHLSIPCFRNDLCPIATNMMYGIENDKKLTAIEIESHFIHAYYYIGCFKIEAICRLGPFRAKFRVPRCAPDPVKGNVLVRDSRIKSFNGLFLISFLHSTTQCS